MSNIPDRLRNSKNIHALIAAMVKCGHHGKRIAVFDGNRKYVVSVTEKSQQGNRR